MYCTADTSSLPPSGTHTDTYKHADPNPPEAVEDMSVRKHPQHDVLGGGVMDEGTLGVDEEHIRNPDLFHQPPIKGHALIGGAGEGQALVLPIVS